MANRKYTEQEAFNIARKFDDVAVFRKQAFDVWSYLHRHHLLNKITWMKGMHHYYTIEEFKSTIARYNNINDFRTKEPKMYATIRARNLTELLASLERISDSVDGDMAEILYVYEFQDTMTAYVGRTCRKLSYRHREHCDPVDPVAKYAFSIGVPVPKPLVMAKFSIKKHGLSGDYEKKAIALYQAIGWNLINSQPGGSLGSLGHGKWTLRKLKTLAKPFKYWVTFMRQHKNAYDTIMRKQWQKHFPWLKHKSAPSGTWMNMSKNDAHDIAKMFKERCEFRKAYPTLAMRCSKEGWLDEWGFPAQKNMRRVVRYTLDGKEIDIFESVSDAAKGVGVNASCILGVISGRQHICANSIWAYEDTDVSSIKFPGLDYDPYNTAVQNNPNCRKVVQYTKDGALKATFASIASAARTLNIHASTIKMALLGKNKTAGGYKWAYADEA